MKLAYTISVRFPLSGLAGRKELDLASLNGRSKARAYIFPATTLQIPALWPIGAGELSGSDPLTGPFWAEPVLKTRGQPDKRKVIYEAIHVATINTACASLLYCYRHAVDLCKTGFRLVFLNMKQSAIKTLVIRQALPLLIATQTWFFLRCFPGSSEAALELRHSNRISN